MGKFLRDYAAWSLLGAQELGCESVPGRVRSWCSFPRAAVQQLPLWFFLCHRCLSFPCVCSEWREISSVAFGLSYSRICCSDLQHGSCTLFFGSSLCLDASPRTRWVPASEQISQVALLKPWLESQPGATFNLRKQFRHVSCPVCLHGAVCGCFSFLPTGLLWVSSEVPSVGGGISFGVYKWSLGGTGGTPHHHLQVKTLPFLTHFDPTCLKKPTLVPGCGFSSDATARLSQGHIGVAAGTGSQSWKARPEKRGFLEV